MTLDDTITGFSEVAAAKTKLIAKNPLGFWIAAMMAGAYVGLGILLIFSLGQSVDPSIRSLVMGTSFGIALTLVVFAGSELFTGHTMFMTIGRLTGSVKTADVLRTWGMTWFGNLAGCLLLGALFVAAGGGAILKDGGAGLLYGVAAKKMAAAGIELLVRGILCNWLVCLALWSASRTTNDAAKCILIFWCLFAFIASGYEHSIANMTIFAVALFSDHQSAISLAGAAHNLAWVTAGNIIAGALFMGVGYWVAAGRPVSQDKADALYAPSAPNLPNR